MSLGKKLTTFAAALVLAGSALASEEVCPNLSDIQAEGISMAEQVDYNYYVGYTVSNYNTPSTWGFAIAFIEADSTEDAIELSNEILSNMSAPGVPGYGEDNEMYCLYDTGVPFVFAVAVKDYFGMSPMKMKQYLKKMH